MRDKERHRFVSRRWAKEHPQRRKLNNQKYRNSNKDKINKDNQKFIKCNPKYAQTYYQLHKQEILVRVKKRQKIVNKIRRDTILQKYSTNVIPSCMCCGETIQEFLTIGHKNNDGSADRKIHGDAGVFYDYLLKIPRRDDLELQCYNCNCASFRNGYVCPHKTERLNPLNECFTQ